MELRAKAVPTLEAFFEQARVSLEMWGRGWRVMGAEEDCVVLKQSDEGRKREAMSYLNYVEMCDIKSGSC